MKKTFLLITALCVLQAFCFGENFLDNNLRGIPEEAKSELLLKHHVLTINTITESINNTLEKYKTKEDKENLGAKDYHDLLAGRYLVFLDGLKNFIEYVNNRPQEMASYRDVLDKNLPQQLMLTKKNILSSDFNSAILNMSTDDLLHELQNCKKIDGLLLSLYTKSHPNEVINNH